MNEIDNRVLLTTDELAALFKVSRKTVYSLATQRKIRFHKVGRELRFDRDDIMAFLEENRVEAINL